MFRARVEEEAGSFPFFDRSIKGAARGGEEAGAFPLHSTRQRSVEASEEAGSFRAREEAGSFSRQLVVGIEEAGLFSWDGRRWRRFLVGKEEEAGSFPSSRLLLKLQFLMLARSREEAGSFPLLSFSFLSLLLESLLELLRWPLLLEV
jgi:hypothetical protein